MAEKLEYTRNWTNEADFPHLSFTKNWENPEDYPTYEPDEVQVRKDMQSLHDEVKDYINDKLIPEILASDATEATRTENENQRIANEEERSSAEAQRVEAENARADQEAARAAAEEQRASAETQRADAEAARVAAEKKRVTAEEERKTAESARNSWENYDAEKTYAPGNKVYYQGSSYVCLKECTGATPSAGSAWWQLIAHGGDQPQENAMFLYEVSRKLPESKRWTGAAYGAGRFVVASGYVKTTVSTITGTTVKYTPGKTIGSGDGESWESIDFPSNGGWTDIIYANGMFLAANNGHDANVYDTPTGDGGNLPKGEIAYSADGLNWTVVDSGSKTGMKRLAYGAGRFVAISTRQAICSTNATGWSSSEWLLQSDSNYRFGSIAFGADKFVAVARNERASSGSGASATWPRVATHAAVYSADGHDWKYVRLPVDSFWYDIVYGGGRFVIVGGTSVLYSDDGLTWSATTAPVELSKVIYANGRYVGIRGPAYSDASAQAAYSDDGITWIETTLPETKTWGSLVYGNGKFFAFSDGDTYAISEDGINWAGDVHEIRNNRGENITDRVKSVLGIS